VGTRVTEIPDLTESDIWRYVQSGENHANAIRKGKSPSDPNRDSIWNPGLAFLRQTPGS